MVMTQHNRWTAQDSHDACLEGWDLFEASNGYRMIQRNDDATKFRHDEEALEHVKSIDGPLHRKALELHFTLWRNELD